jgi:glutathione reductase (NADPH)
VDLDLVVIGGGSGGVRAARFAANLGAKVAIVEADRFGGTCVNVGCVPKKLFVYAAELGDCASDARGFGWEFGEARFSWDVLRAGVADQVRYLNGVYEKLLTDAGVRIVRGRARLVGPQAVDVGGERLVAARILVATGGRPVVPSIPGAELGVVSDAMFDLPALPRRAAVIGGGYIGVEFAGILAGLGVETTIVAKEDRLLVHFDRSVSLHLGAEMEKEGIRVVTGSQARSLTRAADGIRVECGSGTVDADLVLFAVGRRANTHGLGLEDVGVALDARGAVVVVDDDFRTTAPTIHAVGDVVGRAQLTPVALAEGMAFARRIYGGSTGVVRYENIPTAVFGRPNVGTVGLSEEAAVARGHDVVVFESTFRPMFHGLSGRRARALVKLVVDRPSDRVLGVHVVGDDAGEIVQGFAVALVAGATKAQFDATIGIHPTAAEELVTLRTPKRP